MSNKLKEKLHNKECLQKELDEVLKSNLTDFLNSTHNKKEEATGSMKFTAFAGVFLLSTIGFLYLSGANTETFLGKIILMLSLFWTTILLLSGKSWMSNSRLLSREMNMALSPIITNTLDKMVMYTYDDIKTDDVKEALNKSNVLGSPIKKLVSNDRYYLYGNQECVFHEVKASSEGKNFSGVFAVLPVPGVGDTEILLEGDMEYRVLDGVLYVLLPNHSISINVSLASTKPEAINRYAMDAMLPIWHSLMLAEELRA